MYYCEGNLVLNLVQSLQSIHTIVANCFKLEDNCLMDLVQFKVSVSRKWVHILSQYFTNLCKIKWFPCNKIWYFADALWIYFFDNLLFYVYSIPPFSKIEKLMLLKLHFLNKVRIKIRWYAEHMIVKQNYKGLKWWQNKQKQEWEPV